MRDHWFVEQVELMELELIAFKFRLEQHTEMLICVVFENLK
jgi:hypothetical protein